MAIGYCRLSAQAFWSMTMREVMWRIKAEVERENRELERAAQLACWLLNDRRKRKDQLKMRDLVRWAPPKRRRLEE